MGGFFCVSPKALILSEVEGSGAGLLGTCIKPASSFDFAQDEAEWGFMHVEIPHSVTA